MSVGAKEDSPRSRERKVTSTPHVLQHTPALIEVQLPVNRISAEAYKERKAGAGQTLTALGSYWKGRKPLILVRATVLASLLPATDDPLRDLGIFLKLMGMHDASFARRIKSISPRAIDPDWPRYYDLLEWVENKNADQRLVFRRDLTPDEKNRMIGEYLCTLPYDERLAYCYRPEECDDSLHAGFWDEINAHLGTAADSLPELVEQLGILRFGHRPRLADTFCGGGSIPFEAARIGCDVHASDLNPIACMLTWGALNIIGADEPTRAGIEQAQREVAAAVNDAIIDLGIEHDAQGNRAKAYLYCLETRCPKTHWMVPMAPSWVISKTRNVCARLVPDHDNKRYAIEIVTGASAEEMAEAAQGTVRDGRLVHPMNPNREGVAISVIRGDHKDAEGRNRNRLRRWERHDFMPRPDDIFQERLYCIHWMDGEEIGNGKSRPRAWFAAVTDDDLERERRVERIVAENLTRWQEEGLVPDMEIEPGDKTDELIRTRGWMYWHQLFNPRQLLSLALMRRTILALPPAAQGAAAINLCMALDNCSRLCHWNPGHPGSGEYTSNVFYNQAFNCFYNYSCRSLGHISDTLLTEKRRYSECRKGIIETRSAKDVAEANDLFVTDPPYADAVHYHEITEYFIAWLRKNPPADFHDWLWDSRRALAIQGSDEDFRRDMVTAYQAMAAHMPNNGLQVVMFTHQDAGVWADLAGIMWAAGLRVTSAWNVVTETESATKQGNYVQGTILLVLRKRLEDRNAKKMDIELEVEDEVREQLQRMQSLDDWAGERLYTDGDLQLAAYAAALRVITGYRTIDRRDVGADVYRKLARGEKTVIRELIDYASAVANNLLIPDGCSRSLWRELDPRARFYFRMLDMETAGPTKVADYQSFAKTFGVDDYTELMASTRANRAALAGALDFRGRLLGTGGFGATPLRQVLFAIWKTHQKDTPKEGIAFLKAEIGPDYWAHKARLTEIAGYLRDKNAGPRPAEHAAAALLVEALKTDRM